MSASVDYMQGADEKECQPGEDNNSYNDPYN